MNRSRLLITLLLLFGLSPAKAIPVDLGLSLVIDVSGSVSATEYDLMMDGYAEAFRDTDIQNKLLDGSNGAVAINAIFFSDSAFTTTLDDFQILTTVTEIDLFADLLDNFARPGSGGTNASAGMNKATSLLTATSGPETNSLVMDVSGDGTGNVVNDQAARDAAAAAGITVNGLSIGGIGIDNYYTANIITADGFLQPSASFADFDAAVKTKIELEAGGSAPEPGTLVLMASALVGLRLRLRRRA